MTGNISPALPPTGLFQRMVLLILSIYEKMCSLMTVSYTHLDVYKRQAVLSEPDLERPSQRKNLKGLDISLRDVTFAYKDTQVLNGITLDIKQGTTTALVGPSGSGKSTIAKLIASYWDVGGGHITICLLYTSRTRAAFTLARMPSPIT